MKELIMITHVVHLPRIQWAVWNDLSLVLFCAVPIMISNVALEQCGADRCLVLGRIITFTPYSGRLQVVKALRIFIIFGKVIGAAANGTTVGVPIEGKREEGGYAEQRMSVVHIQNESS
jgi:hypothetical protein